MEKKHKEVHPKMRSLLFRLLKFLIKRFLNQIERFCEWLDGHQHIKRLVLGAALGIAIVISLLLFYLYISLFFTDYWWIALGILVVAAIYLLGLMLSWEG